MDSVFHLDAPPGFRGLDGDLPVQTYRRDLPHWRQDGATYFVTFRLEDSLPQEKLIELKQMKLRWQRKFDARREEEDVSEIETRKARFEQDRLLYRKMEFWLDQGMGECVLRDCATREILCEGLGYFDGERYELGSYVIMPNHVHLLIKPLFENALEKILQSRKRGSARKINELRGKQGAVWQAESFDRIVRDTQHLWRCVQYIGRNPGKANLGAEAYTRWVKPEWREIGWGFVD
ncbi:MAG: transposase [Verrucomicrobiales bacterium]|nr:transposase [Verrucomicrobiales bacterium]